MINNSKLGFRLLTFILLFSFGTLDARNLDAINFTRIALHVETHNDSRLHGHLEDVLKGLVAEEFPALQRAPQPDYTLHILAAQQGDLLAVSGEIARTPNLRPVIAYINGTGNTALSEWLVSQSLRSQPTRFLYLIPFTEEALKDTLRGLLETVN